MIIVYYVHGKREEPLKGPQKECRKCAAVNASVRIDDFDSERDAQVAFKWGAVNIVNAAIDSLWKVLWNLCQCANQECKVRRACGAEPSFVRVTVVTVMVPDPAAPNGQKAVWRMIVALQRKIECVPAEPDTHEADVPPEHYGKTLPPPNEEEQPSPGEKHPGPQDDSATEHTIPADHPARFKR